MDVKKILEQAVKMDASDIFLFAGSPYAFKIQKEIIKQDDVRLMPEDLKDIVQHCIHLRHIVDMKIFRKMEKTIIPSLLANIGRFVSMCIAKEIQKLQYCEL